MSERIEKGKQVTRDAIARNDPVALQRCLRTFLDMKAPAKDISDAIGDCPVGLFEKTGFALVIESGAAGRNITLGKDVSWPAVREYLATGADKAALQLPLETMDLFGGRIEAVESLGAGAEALEESEGV